MKIVFSPRLFSRFVLFLASCLLLGTLRCHAAPPARNPVSADPPAFSFPEEGLTQANFYQSKHYTGPVQDVVFPTESADGTPLDFSVRLVNAEPWVTVTRETGITPQPFSLRFDPSKVPGTGTYQTTLEITAGGVVHQYPVVFLIDIVSTVAMLADPIRNVVYAVNSGVGFSGNEPNGGSVLVLDPDDGTVRKVIRVPKRPSDIDFNADGSAIYVACQENHGISRIDPDLGKVTRSISVPEDWPSDAETHAPTISAGSGDLVYYTDGPAIRLVDFKSGAVLDSFALDDLPPDLSETTMFRDVFFDRRKNLLYFTRSAPWIGILDTSGGKLAYLGGYEPAETPSLIFKSYYPLLGDISGERLFFSSLVFNLSDRSLTEFPASPIALSPYGDRTLSVDLSLTNLRDARTGVILKKGVGFLLRRFAASFTPDQTSFIHQVHDAKIAPFIVRPFEESVRPLPPGIRPDPPDGGSFNPDESAVLRWSELPLTTGYRVYIGSDSAAVAAARPGSPEDKGTVATNSFLLDPVPASSLVFWRIDALRGDKTVPGQVFSFTIPLFQVEPTEFSTVLVKGSAEKTILFNATDREGNGVPWTATSSVSWARLVKSSGNAGEPVEVELLPTSLPTGDQNATIIISHEGMSIRVPLALEIFQPKISRLQPDPAEPVIYALHPGEYHASPSYILAIDPATALFTKTIPLDGYPMDFCVHPHDRRLYVPIKNEHKIQVIDIDTGASLPPIDFPEGTRFSAVTHGRSGFIYCRMMKPDRNGNYATYQINTATGEEVAELPSPGFYPGTAVRAADPAGHSYYMISGNGEIKKYDISTDEPTLLEPSEHSSLPSGQWGACLSVSNDGAHIAANAGVFDSGLASPSRVGAPGKVQALTSHGEIFATADAIFWTDSGAEIAKLPFHKPPGWSNPTIVAFSSDDQYLVSWGTTEKRLATRRLDSMATLPGPFPRPAQRFDTTVPESLSWSPVPGAIRYHVYFGTDSVQVSRAGPGSPLEIGTPAESSLTLNEDLVPGTRYYWRVDSENKTSTSKGSVIFFDIPFTQNPDPVEAPKDFGYDFGKSIAAYGDMISIGADRKTSQRGCASLYRFNSDTGEHSFIQTLAPAKNPYGNNFGLHLAMGPNLVLASDTDYSSIGASWPDEEGIVYAYRADQYDQWRLDQTLPDPPIPSHRDFGGGLAYGANLLLTREGKGYNNAQIRVISWFEFPGWAKGQELVATPRRNNDGFGSTMVMDGARALVGAPGFVMGPAGSAFVFEFDANRKSWRQTYHLAPREGKSSDSVGTSLAFDGSYAALGNIGYGVSETHDVYLFSRSTGASWREIKTFKDPDEVNATNFGAAVAISGDMLFIAAPNGKWSNQTGTGVVYCYRKNGSAWDMLPPLVAPPDSKQFGESILVHDAWLFVTYRRANRNDPSGKVLKYWLGPDHNRKPRFLTPPPAQVVNGKQTDIPVTATDPDGVEDLEFLPAVLPDGLSLEDLGAGRARITGVPTAAPGTRPIIRIDVADGNGATATQIALASVLSLDDAPVIGNMPASIDLETGDDLILAPAVVGFAPIVYQWKRNGIDIPGAIDPSLKFTMVGEDASGTYTLTATNVVDSVTSPPVSVAVRPADRFAGDWPTFGSGPDHDGYQPAMLGRHRFQLTWSVDASGFTSLIAAGGKVFASYRVDRHNVKSRAFDLKSGDPVWETSYESNSDLGMPNWHKGRIYIAPIGSGHLFCLDATSGATLWKTTDTFSFGTPGLAVDDGGIYARGGSDGKPAILGFGLDGTFKFSTAASQHDFFIPALSFGRLYSLSQANLSEYNPGNGLSLWSRSLDYAYASQVPTTPVVKDSRAYIITDNKLNCVDVNFTKTIWTIDEKFTGTPALSPDRVFAIDGTTIRSFHLGDGSESTSYRTPASYAAPFRNQPLVLNDILIASTGSHTYVFDIESGRILQTIPFGGSLAYSEAYLLIDNSNHGIKAYYANIPPEFDESIPTEIDSAAAAADLHLPLGPYATDPDPGDTLRWAVRTSNRSLFRTLKIDRATGDLTVIYNPWQSGSSDVMISITDRAGNLTKHTITFTVPPHPAPQVDVADTLVLNHQTGLYEHTITVTNSGAREIAGFDLTVTGLPDGVCVWNASDCTNGPATIQHRQRLAAGASVTLILEYYSKLRGTKIEPEISVALVTKPESDPAAPDGGFAIDRCLRQADGAMLIEFTAEPGALYEIHYSDDGENWKLSPVRVRAAGNRVQWIDRGPPRTDTPPDETPTRFYRVRKITEPNHE